MRLVLSACLVLAGLAAPAFAHQEKLSGGEWVLAGETGQRAPSLRFEGGRVAGTGGCNRLAGSYRHEGSALSFTPFAVTRMACPGPFVEKEQAFFDMLGKVKAVEVAGDRMELRDGAGKALAVFTRRVAQ